MWMDARSPKLQTGRSMCPQGPHIELSTVWGMEAREWGAKPWISFESVTRNWRLGVWSLCEDPPNREIEFRVSCSCRACEAARVVPGC